MKRIGLLIEPVDVLFFRGGRPFGAGLIGQSGLPSPQTFLGCLRTALLHALDADLEKMRGHQNLEEAFRAAGAAELAKLAVRGPWLAKRSEAGYEPVFRRPADLAWEGEEKAAEHAPIRVKPERIHLPGWLPKREGMLPVAGPGRRTRRNRSDWPQWITLNGLRCWARGGIPAATDFHQTEELFTSDEERTGIKIHPARRSSDEGMIYTIRMLRLNNNARFYAEVIAPESIAKAIENLRLVSFGGEGKLARLETCELIEWPKGSDNSSRSVIVLLTPGFFRLGWLPKALEQAPLEGALVDHPVCISGWDIARNGPKPTRFGVPEGSVYFVGTSGSIPETFAESSEDGLAGYGFYLKGRYPNGNEG